MLTRSVLVKVIVFAVVAVAAVVYAGLRYAGIGGSLANPGYTVRMELADSGGIFTNAEVAYRGVTIGKVTALRLTHDGIEIDLRINAGTPQVPADLKAAVADRSAVGEQYVDLVPNTNTGPYLADGSVIGMDRTNTPLPTEELLTNLDQLVASVPTGSLRTVVDELDNAFNGTGPALGTLLDSTSDFTRTAQQQLPQTIELLQTGKTVLDTQNAEAGAIESFSTSLNQVAAQLKASDPDLRTLIANVPPAATQITDLLNESGPQLGAVLANLLTTANVLRTRTSGLELALVAYPELVGAAGSVISPDGGARLGLALNLFDPPPCTAGYQGTKHRPGNDTTPATINFGAYCAEPSATGVDVRGAQNAPFGGNPPPAAPGAGAGGTGGDNGSNTQPRPGTGPTMLTGSTLAPVTLAQLLGIQ